MVCVTAACGNTTAVVLNGMVTKMIKLHECPYCGGYPKLIRVGDHEEYVVYICEDCYKTPVQYCEASLTDTGAAKVWNRSVEKVLRERGSL